MLVDFWHKGVRYQKTLFAIVMIATILVFFPFAYFVLKPALFPVVAWFFTLPTMAHAAH
jgi:hypothetical protein